MANTTSSGASVFMLLADDRDTNCFINYQTTHGNLNITTFSGGFGFQVGFQKGATCDDFYWTRIESDSSQPRIVMVLNHLGNFGINT